MKKKLNRGLEIEGVALTMLDSRTNLGAQVVDEVRKVFGSKVYSTIIPRNVRLGEAPSYGQPISVYDPKSTAPSPMSGFATNSSIGTRRKANEEAAGPRQGY